ncbi:LPS export ABC transporter permease LptG [Azospirillum thermophilum]|uniref:LPS export ABC transporter permease LptG n=1 Tax=Azospirillum thermophilum TaxID=2202148 RepID=A0A2S2CX09_9PROT|nr:LPS export ABC transporter permease LptG [Azospirillum thermophilum]AWK89021.1 LPS export ABC transporter permease LptG [Azospirillum thermophilum]
MYSSPTLSRYIGRQFVTWFVLLLLILLSIVLVLDTVELLRRAGTKPNVTFGLIVEMAFLKLPEIGQQMFPFVILFAGMFTFWRLTRSAELVVARAVGVSAWQFLTPVLIAAALIGVVKVTLINPVGAVFIAKYDQLQDRYLKLKSSSMAISRSGLWLRQTNEKQQFFIHADLVDPLTFRLAQVIVFEFDPDQRYLGRVDAPGAVLSEKKWVLQNAVLNRPGKDPEALPTFTIPTELDMATIEESFSPPETISFWELPRFIQTLETTGFPAIRHRLHYQSLLAQPLLFVAMVLFAAAFSLRLPRRGGTMAMVTGGVLTGFVLFVTTDVIRTFGMSETIPVLMAAWSPAGISLLLGTAALLHLEDG